jgi:medium-chain acyl-[acyl-carrier-protein] hydrolase
MIQKNNWFKVFAEKPDAVCRLFCFHYAGGGASAFHSWVKSIPEDVEVFAVQLPGRENRLSEYPIRELTELIQKLAIEMSTYLDKPFIFFGHSMGALISYELTCYLSNKPEYLYVSGRPSPHLPRKSLPIHHLREEEFITEIKKFEGMPDEILNDPELRELFFPALRADLEMCEKYTFREREKLSVPVKVYGGNNDQGVNESDLLAWNYVTDSFKGIALFEGGHFYFRNTGQEFLKYFKRDLEDTLKNLRLKNSSSVFFSKPSL